MPANPLAKLISDPPVHELGRSLKASQRPRIALALEYPLLQQGGTEVLVRALLRGLAERFEIVLVSGDPSREALPQDFAGLVCDQLTWDLASAAADQGKSLAAGLRERQVALAHFHFGGTFNWRANRFWRCPVYHLGMPCLATTHFINEWLNCSVRPDRPQWQKHLFQIFALFSRSMLYRRLKFDVCVSQHDRARARNLFPLARRKLLCRYHSLLPAAAPPPDLENREPAILCVGTICRRKAQDLLAEAFCSVAPRHPRWRLELIGRTEMPEAEVAERARACAARSGLADRVLLPGALPYEESIERVKRASILAMPSLREPLGLALQEGLFHGCVGLASRVGGIPELLDDGVNGLLVPPSDVAALGAALDRLMSDQTFLAKLRRETRPSILRKRMTLEAMVQSYVELYERCLAL
jgi:glycosyltransferase involved in cell wall biosynthesis